MSGRVGYHTESRTRCHAMLPSWHNDGVDWIGKVNDDVGSSILGCLDVELKVGCLLKVNVK